MSNFSTSSDSNPLIPPLPAHGRHPTHNRSCPDMTSPIRFATASLLAASLAFGLAACKPIDNDAKKEDKADAAAGGNDIAKSTGLKTEKEQASYMVGLSVGKSLEPIKDEVAVRSQEHTSELQSLMSISYAVFFLNKKQNILTLLHITVAASTLRILTHP